MRAPGRNIIVIGTSAGGLVALDELLGRLPTDIPASLFIVQHMAPEASGRALLHRLGKHAAFGCKLAVDGEAFRPGRVYIAPPDYHLLVKARTMLVTKGARENRYRPAIDPLFRSAAVTHGPRVIGVVLSGMLDDGTTGLNAIKRCGGVAIVQDPKEASYSEMPRAALAAVKVNHCAPVSRIAELLDELSRAKPGPKVRIPEDVRIEAEIAERILSDVERVEGLGEQVPYNCPNCGGVLWGLGSKGRLRYRCHTGHSFTAANLLTIQSEKIEETLWISLRMFEERKNLLRDLMATAPGARSKESYAQRARETEVHIERVRSMLLAREPKLTTT
jgi:two-component system, chemotaxis family, protein-glutamate methylesterase/glutaminase